MRLSRASAHVIVIDTKIAMTEFKPKPKKKSNGSNCCIVGCHTTSGKCKGDSFITIPKKGVNEKQDNCRAALIHAVNRCDSSFNPKKAKICSRHFDVGCVKYGPSGKCSGLVSGSLPTRWMPTKSYQLPRTLRPEPTPREPPMVPQKVNYYSIEDLKRDAEKVMWPWNVCHPKDLSLQFILLRDKGCAITVTIEAYDMDNLYAEVKVMSIEAPHLKRDLQSTRLSKVLNELQEYVLCTGIPHTALQEFAELPDGTCRPYYRHITFEMTWENVPFFHCPVITVHFIITSITHHLP